MAPKRRTAAAVFAIALIARGGAAARAQSVLTTSGPQPAATPRTCEGSAPHRQLDFWVGEWDVLDGGKRVGSNRLTSILNGCALLEEYSEPEGYSGKSVSFYDSQLGKWRQTWVDLTGGVSEFVGSFSDGSLAFEGETHTREGLRVLRKMLVTNLGGGRVRHYSERSVDGGKTWQVVYDFTYVRKDR